MLPASVCQFQRSTTVCPTKNSVHIRRSFGCGTRLTAHTMLWAVESIRSERSVVTFALQGDETAGVAEQSGQESPPATEQDSDTIAPFKAARVSEADWESVVLESDVPVFVDFWAPWCGPCKMIGPTIDEIIDELGDKFKAVKVNTDKNPGIAKRYGIRSIPTCMIFKDGKKVDTVIGAVKKTVLKSSLQKFLGSEK